MSTLDEIVEQAAREVREGDGARKVGDVDERGIFDALKKVLPVLETVGDLVPLPMKLPFKLVTIFSKKVLTK